MAPFGEIFRSSSSSFLGFLRNPKPKPNLNPNINILSLLMPSRSIVSKLFVGGDDMFNGLSYYTTEDGLSEAFAKFGQVVEAKIILERDSQRSKGFGFVTFASQEEADKALLEMNGKILNGRRVFVDHAKAKQPFHEALPTAVSLLLRNK